MTVVLSEVTVLPAASWTVAVRIRVVPDVSAVVAPERAILAALPTEGTRTKLTVGLPPLADNQGCDWLAKPGALAVTWPDADPLLQLMFAVEYAPVASVVVAAGGVQPLGEVHVTVMVAPLIAEPPTELVTVP